MRRGFAPHASALATTALRLLYDRGVHPPDVPVNASRARRIGSHTLAAGLLLIPLITVAASLWVEDDAPWSLRAATLGLTALTMVSPVSGVMVAVALMPLGAILSFAAGPFFSWTEPLAVAFLAGYLLNRLRSAPQGSPAVASAAWAFVAVITASTIVGLSVQQARTDFAWPFLQNVGTYALHSFFTWNLEYRMLNRAAAMVLGVALLGAGARVALERPSMAGAAARMVAVGTAALGAWSVQRLIVVAVSSGQAWSTLPALALNTRVTASLRDVNAAGSLFALGLTVIALMPATTGSERTLRVGAAVLTAAGLWLTGSRLALASAAIVVLLGMSGRIVGRLKSRVPVWAAAGAIVAVACLLVLMVAARPRSDDRRATAARATNLRVEFAKTAFRMTATAPIFGVGVGEFQDRSEEFASPSLPLIYRRENAHNNFLQVLAELGVVGCTAFVGVIAIGLVTARRVLRAGAEEESAAAALFWGAVAFLLTMVGGHPLLTREAAFTWWLVLGIASGAGQRLTPTVAAAPWQRWGSRAAMGAAIVMLALTPWRARAAVSAADFEHQGIGLGGWHSDKSGMKYREALGTAIVFVPSDTPEIELPLKAAATPLVIQLSLEGTVANRVTLTPDSWTPVRLLVPRRHRRFQRLQIDIISPPAAGSDDVPRVLVGKVLPR